MSAGADRLQEGDHVVDVVVEAERPVRERTAVAELNEEDVLAFLLTEIIPFVSGRG